MQDEIGHPEDLDTMRDSLAAVIRNADQMNSMIQDLVTTARLASGQLHLSRHPLALKPYVSELLERYRTLWPLQRIHTALPDDLPPIWADPVRLERILVNLISNALKYSAADSPVTLSAEHVAQEVIIAVRDVGVGMSTEAQEHLFEPFFRAQATRRIEGIGLGLYITAQLVKAHGGNMWVESELGKGSTFSFSMPVYSATQCP